MFQGSDTLDRLQFSFGLSKVKSKMGVCRMASVSELVEDVAEVMKEPVETVNAYARALIDAGLLPKSRGRAIAQVTRLHIVTLFSAVCLEPKIKDAAETVEKYLSLRLAGVPEGAPKHISFSAGEYLTAVFEVIHTRPNGEDNKAARKKAINTNILFVRNWPEIEIQSGGEDGGATLFRFKDGNPSHWEDQVKRVTILNGRAALLLGFGKGRDYIAGTVEG
jgi:hypothetical protein